MLKINKSDLDVSVPTITFNSNLLDSANSILECNIIAFDNEMYKLVDTQNNTILIGSEKLLQDVIAMAQSIVDSHKYSFTLTRVVPFSGDFSSIFD